MIWNRPRLLTLQPHSTGSQKASPRQTVPTHVNTNTVDVDRRAALEPEPTALAACTVHAALVVVSIVCTKLHSVLKSERVLAGVTRVSADMNQIAEILPEYNDRAVLGVVPAGRQTGLELELELVPAGDGQLMKQFITQPVVALGVVKAGSELVPRPVEEVPFVVQTSDVLLDQQRDTQI